MRHRASRPLLDQRHRVPRAAARLLGEAARHGPAQALTALMVVLSLGTGAYVAVASVTGGSSNGQAESAGRTASRDAGLPDLSNEMRALQGRTPAGSSSEAGASAPGQSESPIPATSVTSAPPSDLGQVTGSPSTGTATLSTSPSQPSTTPSTSPSPPSAPPSTSPEDVTPPETSLSEEFPAVDVALFSFSANEPASFTCSLDGAAYTSCDSPTQYADVDPGWHTLAVRATDAAGNIDPSPAETRWHVRDGRSQDR